jgi:hypothetical protein
MSITRSYRFMGTVTAIEWMVAMDSTSGPCFALMGRHTPALGEVCLTLTGRPRVWTVGFALKGRRIPAVGNTLGLGVAPFMRSEGTPHPG